ncbi:DUF1398 domain-containing protein [bacterium]|nr:DUF1398 domain-containing protein [bacterium]
MFTKAQIDEASSRTKTGADFPQFVQDLRDIGVSHYENYVKDGQTIYHGTDGFELNMAPKYPELPVSENSSAEDLKQALATHQQGRTDYMTFCKEAAAAGVYKWTTHIIEMKVTYSDKEGNKMLVEAIPGLMP